MRFVVTASAMVVMFQAFQVEYYGVAAACAILALFYNPGAPALTFLDEWQCAMVMASAGPFGPSIARRDGRKKNARTESND